MMYTSDIVNKDNSTSSSLKYSVKRTTLSVSNDEFRHTNDNDCMPWLMMDDDLNSQQRPFQRQYNTRKHVNSYRNLSGYSETKIKKSIEPVKLTAFRNHEDEDSKDSGPSASKGQSGSYLSATNDTKNSGGEAALSDQYDDDKKPFKKTDEKCPIVNEPPSFGNVNDGIQVVHEGIEAEGTQTEGTQTEGTQAEGTQTEGTQTEEGALDNPNNADDCCLNCLTICVELCSKCKMCNIM